MAQYYGSQSGGPLPVAPLLCGYYLSDCYHAIRHQWLQCRQVTLASTAGNKRSLAMKIKPVIRFISNKRETSD